MKIILTDKIQKLGEIGDVVEVSSGYARNFLIPKGFAVLANDSTKKVLAENLKQRSHKEASLIKDAEELKKKLMDTAIVVKAKVSEDGSSLFGSVTNAIFSENLSKSGFEIDKKYIKLAPSTIIKKLGNYTANIRLHRDVIANLDFEVVKE